MARRIDKLRLKAQPYVEWADTSFAGRLYARLLELELVDRAVALAAKLFLAFFPFVLAISVFSPPDVRAWVTDALINRLGLRGYSLDQLRGAFVAASESKAAIGIIGLIFLFFYATSFATALQRAYLRAWRRPGGGGLRNKGRGAGWLASMVVFLALTGLAGSFLRDVPVPGTFYVIATVFMTGLWWWTARLMLRGEVRWIPLLPGAVITALMMITYIAAAPIWMPSAVASNQSQFGYFGVTLSLVSYFVGVAFVVVIGAASAPVLAEGSSRFSVWLRGPGDQSLEPGARPALPAPNRKLKLADALGFPARDKPDA